MKKQSEKEITQDKLMSTLQGALDRLRDEGDPSESAFIVAYAEQQFRRIEKLLGYQPNSWRAGA